jgi:hypothetical protein
MRVLGRAIAIAMAALSMLVVAQTAQAADPSVATTASLTNVGERNSDGLAETATAGELVNASASVENLLPRRQVVRITLTLQALERDPVEIRYPLLLGANRTARVSLTFPILRFVPLGTYRFSVTATGDNGFTSTSNAQIEIIDE